MFEGLFSPSHLLVVFVIALVVMGPSRLPELGASLGKSIRELRKAMNSQAEESANGSVDRKEDGQR